MTRNGKARNAGERSLGALPRGRRVAPRDAPRDAPYAQHGLGFPYLAAAGIGLK